MAGFLTLPFELHHHVATFLLPPFPKPANLPDGSSLPPTDMSPAHQTARLKALYKHHHDYVPEGSLEAIMNLIVALGDDSGRQVHQNPKLGTPSKANHIKHHVRGIYTLETCILLKKTAATQAVLGQRQAESIFRDTYDFLIQASFLQIHNRFGKPPEDAYRHSGKEFEFWRTFFQVWDDPRYAVPPVHYEPCCKERLCELDIHGDAALRYWLENAGKRRRVQLPTDSPKRYLGGSWASDWEEKERSEPYWVDGQLDSRFLRIHILLQLVYFLKRPEWDERRETFTSAERPGLIAAMLSRTPKRSLATVVALMELGHGQAGVDQRREHWGSVFEDFVGNLLPGVRYEGAAHGRVKECVLDLVIGSFGRCTW
ncbi:hypothetical protein BJ508DRAFT_42374 [Ascobolus immersus RN42]|uniref:Uncharacterized protein n=1 Tax=Ascobolus immersus RN42 TaxID=1160509 RepID=A0A3N4IJ70_ASCIM|nr:hypothetical protein BJ508DRAFT_42374 [Ascobolus immersus RN42]